jgi:hypothetical protein
MLKLANIGKYTDIEECVKGRMVRHNRVMFKNLTEKECCIRMNKTRDMMIEERSLCTEILL